MKMIDGMHRLGAVEQVADAAGADTDEHLDEFRGGDAEERHACLTGDRPRSQRLAGTRRADQQHAARQPGAELVVLGRVAQEVDDFGQLLLGLLFAGNIGKGDLRSLRIVEARAAAAEAEDVLLAARHLAAHEDDQRDDEDDRQEVDQQAGQDRTVLVLAFVGHVLLLEQRDQLLVVLPDERRNLRLQLRRLSSSRTRLRRYPRRKLRRSCSSGPAI